MSLRRLLRRHSAPSIEPFDRLHSLYPRPLPMLPPDVNTPPSVRITQDSPLRYRGHDAHEQRAYRDCRQHLLGHILSVMRLCEDFRHHHNLAGVQTAKPSSGSLLFTTPTDTTLTMRLLDERLGQCLRHLDHLRTRVTDSASKVLVTGDVNAGKSSLVNTLLQADIVPTHEQPCTSALCEIVDCMQNGGVEEVHCIPDPAHYDSHYSSTYHPIALRHLPKAMEQGLYDHFRIYVRDHRPPEKSLLKHDLATMTWIDSPGLDADSNKTSAIYAGQDDIDAVVFVVNAQNQLTLSAKTFLQKASMEKKPLFIIVNRFDTIKDKVNCKRKILDQIHQVSPSTYEQAEDRVHFVDLPLDAPPASFATLESNLRTFAVEHRMHTKLLPAKRYLVALLTDMADLARSTHELTIEHHQQALQSLARDTFPFMQLLKAREPVLHQVEVMAEHTLESIQTHALNVLEQALENPRPRFSRPPLFSLWPYAHEYRDALLQAWTEEIEDVEREAMEETKLCVQAIQRLGTEHLGPSPWQDKANLKKSYYKPLTVTLEPVDLLGVWPPRKRTAWAISLGLLACLGVRWVDRSGKFGGGWVSIVSLAGSSLWLGLSEIRTGLESKIFQKCKRAAIKTSLADTHARRVSRISRKILQATGRDLELKIQTAIENKARRRSELENQAHDAQNAGAYYTHFIEVANLVLDQVNAVSTDIPTKAPTRVL
ncbi:hypothetical protein J3Q64DRAFT_1370671 [Phycomyces blakesleeanus]|uniref:Dynamin-type G domain-containing protein n=2 Tax=Phycomyces blakesleeanus TaxID=4837 RepID=A0A163B9A6_PHYB8|nr:hypothetical protein PHYBLDRAFT_62295 [Phycomyces blakesleeanus NRRL 1555(-)]OAD78941.1 hypothetical protein PHYBLDRAFT_62295 [Phycomyces blakesleeanus NRRL 1555(-)]|eukprot:XP_018296981.1 hypothetical protein PHYBLDRAFT_62295 [Phycomyces blakesleeanus NRRL 1555(-)]